MMRFLGNNVAKICRLQNRNISSATVTATIDDAPKYLCRAVVVGYQQFSTRLKVSSGN
ncbi:unnamed protein product [Arabidopsis lyrata]|nr:unnamed protein product [Arabidopsis lyrata]